MATPGSTVAPYFGYTSSAATAELDTWRPIISAKSYGADPTGAVDSSSAVTTILGIIGTAPAVIYFPAGTYFLNDYNFGATSNIILRGDPGLTTLTGKTRIVPNYTTPSQSGVVSQRVCQFTGASNVVFEDILFDGQQSVGPTYYGANYADIKALIECRSCTQIRLSRCSVINFTPAGAAATSGGNPNPDPIEGQNQGPIYFKACDDVKLLDTKLLAPCYGEGFVLMNCTHVYTDRMFSTAGISGGQYGTSTPLHIFGPLTKFVTVTNCHWQNSNGSSLEVGGLGMIDVVGNTVDGGGGYNIALSNLGYFSDWDQVGVGLRVSRNRFTNMINNTGSKIPGIYIGSRVDGGFQYRDVAVTDNLFDAVYACITVRGCQDVVVSRNQGSQLYVSTSLPASSEGTGINIDGCVGITCADNRMDMGLVPNSGTSTNRALYGILIQDSEDVQVHDNHCIDGKQNNFRITVQDVYQLNFTGGGTTLRDTLFNLDWFGTPYTVTGQSSGATLSLLGRVITSGTWTNNTAAGYIYGVTKTGTFTNGESVRLNAVTNCAVATGDAAFASLMNRMMFHDNSSRTLTSTVTPYFIQPFNANTMASTLMRWNDTHNGVQQDSNTRAILDGFYQNNIGANFAAAAMSRQTGASDPTRYITLRPGSVTGLQLHSDSAVTAGTVTATVYKNGSPTSLVAVLNTSNTTNIVTLLGIGVVPLATADFIQVFVSSSGLAPTTANIKATVELTT